MRVPRALLFPTEIKGEPPMPFKKFFKKLIKNSSSSHIKKNKKKQVKLILIIDFI